MFSCKSVSTVMIVLALLATLLLNVQAHLETAPAYALRGAQPVGVVDFTVEQGGYALNATMWYPARNSDGTDESYTYALNGLVMAGQALHDALPDIANGPYPLIVYSHGLFGARFENTHLAEHFASWGFVVIAADHIGSTFFDITSPEDVVRSFGYRPQDITRLIDYAEAFNVEGKFAGLLDMNAIGVTGFSFGGYTALVAGGAVMSSPALAATCRGVSPQENALCDASYLQMLAETVGLDAVPQGLWQSAADKRIKAIVSLAPCCVDVLGAQGLAGVTMPLMVIAGTADATAPAGRNGIVAFDNASSETRVLVLIENAVHEVYLDMYTGEIARAHDLIQHFATAFFKTHLSNDANAAALLDPSAVNFAELMYMTVGIGVQ